MTTNLERLLAIAGEQFSAERPILNGNCRRLAGSLDSELMELLRGRNGFYAFESALEVFPAANDSVLNSLKSWNAAESWRSEFGELARGCLFFAQDLVGGQFCVFSGAVYRFDSETAERKLLARSIEEWAGLVLSDHERQTLWPLGQQWQAMHGPLSVGKRLAPKTPFVLGGQFSVGNLYLEDSEKLMRFYGNLARQIHNLPDGARVELKVVD